MAKTEKTKTKTITATATETVKTSKNNCWQERVVLGCGCGFGCVDVDVDSDTDTKIRIRIVWREQQRTKGASSTQPATMTANKPLSAATNRQKLKTVGIHTTPESRERPQSNAPPGPIKASHPPRIDG